MDSADSTRFLSATALAAAYRTGELSPVDVATAHLDAIAAHNPAVNAYCLVDEEAALGSARAAAERHAAGTALGPLDGVPVSIKDLFLTAGWPTLRGSELIDPSDDEWTADAPVVARLREAGAVLLGKTTTPEFGWKGVTHGPRCGITRNPWDHARTSGGSSGGSAAAVGAGLSTLSVGTDGGGSIRIPASFCGIVGFKPTYGRVPLYPASPFGTLAHAGPMTRTVADCITMLDVLCGFDSRDWSATPTPQPVSGSAWPDDLAGVRIAYSPDLGFGTNSTDVQRHTDAAAEVLRGLGATVEPVDLGWSDPAWAYHILWFSGAAKVLRPFGSKALGKIDPGLAAALGRHHGHTAADYLDATQVRMDLGVEMGRLHEEFDVLLTPATPTVAFEAGVDVPAGSADPDWTSWTPYSYPFNLTQQPAISVPSGIVGGLPTAVQFVGARHHDATVLRVASAYEAAQPFPEVAR
ncbi:amidase [Gordonia amarae]|uniref:amidase n=2 Tax=Gordonia amarae TaxID=36821 RepID=G7GL35_9ACTN|nr:amidase [Gordonia amarae]MCS3878981.1 aspartyl-tRNA(Asn)/glutamyl-tRNA(Gln) amidotransferase subunit A [Gordonia amarae]QHN17527.1 amidase [Gordonia amarae]QHN22053.1 amidase [Gordonia amarae]QHN30934.1 amidase [Gordonia amarae]QHN39680.1 amidase [Gordonia amarae]